MFTSTAMISIETITKTNDYVGFFGLLGIFILIVLCIDLCTKKQLRKYVVQYGTFSIFALTFGASVLTLVYSEIFGIIPCGLCWLERIFLYPQIILSGAAIIIKDTFALPRYGIVLSLFGFFISLYHHAIQMGVTSFAKCPASGDGADCAKRFFFEYDFMTFPLLAAILFGFLSALYFYMISQKSSSVQ